MRKILLFLLLIICKDLFSNEPGSIHGKVTDRLTNEFLVGATVVIKGVNQVAKTNSEGEFQFNNLRPGKVSIMLSYVGYNDYELMVNVLPGESISVHASLDVSVRAGEEIVVSAFNRPEKITHAPASISVIGMKDFEQFAGANVSEMVSRIQGIEYVRTGVDGINFNARGLNSAFNNKVFLMVDGRNSMGVGSGGLPMFNSASVMKDDIERMEIVLGPQSALFGPNAHNAVFNIITKNPRKYQGTTVSMSAGSRNQFSGRLRQAAKINQQWAYKLSGEILTGREFSFVDSVYAGGGNYGPPVGIPEKDVIPDFRRLRGEGHLYYSIKPGMDIILSGGGSSNSFLQVTTAARNQMKDVSYNFLQARLLHKNYFINLYNSWASLGTSYVIANYTRDFWNRTHSTILNPLHPLYSTQGRLPADSAELFARRLSNRFKEVNQRLNADAQYHYNFEKAGIFMVAGLSYQKDKPNGFGLNLVDSFERIYVTQYGGVLQFEKKLPLGLRFVSAARYDHHSNFGNFISPKLAILTKIGENNFRLGWARAYAMPSILNQYSRIGGFLFGNGRGVTYIPNMSKYSDPASRVITKPLAPESVSTWELGYKGSIAENLFLDVNYYHGTSKNFIGPAQSVGGRALLVGDIPVTHNPAFAGQVVNDTLKNASFSTYFNYGEVVAYGIDAGLNFRMNQKVNFILRYSWFGSDITKDKITNDANKDNYVSPEERSMNAPRHRGVAIVDLQDIFRQRTYVSISARFVERYEFYSGSQIGTVAGEGKRGKIERPGLPPLFKNFDHGPLGGFTTIDIHAGYQWNEMVKLGLGITNLFNTEQVEFVASPSIGRLIMFEVRVHVPNRIKSK